MRSVARNCNVGVELHESGLALISAALFRDYPLLREHHEHIPLTGSRSMGLSVELMRPIGFNCAPVQGSRAEVHELVLGASIRFSLCDIHNGNVSLISRVGVELLAGAHIVIERALLQIRLTGIHVSSLTFESGYAAPLAVNGAIDVRPALAAAGELPAEIRSDAGFAAILNYLIRVFLKAGLTKPLAAFPVPQIQVLPRLNASLYVRSIVVAGDRLGAYLKHVPGDLETVMPLPVVESDSPHIRVGIVEETIKQLIVGTLPRTFPVYLGSAESLFEVQTGSTVTVLESSTCDLRPGNGARIAIRFTADLHIRLNVTLGHYRLRVPVRLPVGSPSLFEGSWVPRINARPDQERIEIVLRPADGLWDNGVLVIVPEWRRIFKNAVLDWLRRNVSPVLRKVPVIGWVIAKGVEVVASELAGVFATALDASVGAFLSVVGTLLFNAMRLCWNDRLELPVAEIPRKLESASSEAPLINLGLKRFDDPRIVDNAGGEIVLACWMDGEDVVLPDSPAWPDPPVVPPVTPGTPGNPEPPSESFQPYFAAPSRAWTDGETLKYALVTAAANRRLEQVRVVRTAHLRGPERWIVTTETLDQGGKQCEESNVVCDEAHEHLLEEHCTGEEVSSNTPFELDIRFDHQHFGFDAKCRVGGTTLEGSFRLPERVPIVSNEWVFELAGASEAHEAFGYWCRIEVAAGEAAEGWCRAVPISIQFLGIESIEWNDQRLPMRKFEATCPDGVTVVWVEQNSPGRVFRCEHKTGGLTSVLSLMP